MDTECERTVTFQGERWRRYRVERALRAVEDALLWLEPRPAEGVEVRALERLRDDLAVLLRTIVRELQ
jgi:hypothetical protein